MAEKEEGIVLMPKAQALGIWFIQDRYRWDGKSAWVGRVGAFGRDFRCDGQRDRREGREASRVDWARQKVFVMAFFDSSLRL